MMNKFKVLNWLVHFQQAFKTPAPTSYLVLKTGLSTQKVTRLLRQLQDEGYLRKQVTGQGYTILITAPL